MASSGHIELNEQYPTKLSRSPLINLTACLISIMLGGLRMGQSKVQLVGEDQGIANLNFICNVIFLTIDKS